MGHDGHSQWILYAVSLTTRNWCKSSILFADCEFSLLLVIDPATWTFSYEIGSSKTNTRANFLHKIESVSLYIYLLTHSPLSRPCGSLPSWRYYLAQRDNTASYAGYPWGSTSFLPLVTSSV